ncbi:hypothetical protein C8P63_11327 [Melghirimyces profundicolus]|uniref:Coat F domain-containing protein n=1 Tax=Melghirimyces profundicolus TaxID=1242148 RepID=A0A2T6BSN9_9BACL|nr:hypothetical protein [Melghirimyces profundicolus]PTX59082.1 hypothetical protein C8P63_11327 [Melghirimyces profundicolus]
MQLSTKDLNYLKDEMSWELLAFKKCHHYAKECQDPQVKQLIDDIGRKHQQHYEQLLQQLNAANAGGTQATQPAPSGANMTQ